jgi:hypothetical protein
MLSDQDFLRCHHFSFSEVQWTQGDNGQIAFRGSHALTPQPKIWYSHLGLVLRPPPHQTWWEAPSRL